MITGIFLIVATISIAAFSLWIVIFKPMIEERRIWEKGEKNGKKRH